MKNMQENQEVSISLALFCCCDVTARQIWNKAKLVSILMSFLWCPMHDMTLVWFFHICLGIHKSFDLGTRNSISIDYCFLFEASRNLLEKENLIGKRKFEKVICKELKMWGITVNHLSKSFLAKCEFFCYKNWLRKISISHQDQPNNPKSHSYLVKYQNSTIGFELPI